MTLSIDLRQEAILESERIRKLRAVREPLIAPDTSSAVLATVMRTVHGHGRCSAAVFITRTPITDAIGRVIEDLLLAIEVRISATRWRPEQVFSHCQPVVRAACLVEVARRIDSLANRYRNSRDQPRQRDDAVAKRLQAQKRAAFQPGLFGRRGVDGDQTDAQADPGVERPSMLVARETQTILLLLKIPI